jgi:hypothetical protein
MPLLQYFTYAGSCLLAALFAASWCLPASIAPAPQSAVPPHERINIRIHTDYKWPECVEFDTIRPTSPPEVDQATHIGPSETLAQAGRRSFEAIAEMAAAPVKPCYRPPCSVGQIGSETHRQSGKQLKLAGAH